MDPVKSARRSGVAASRPGDEGRTGEGKPKVSVIVPIYKVEKYLEQSLESVVNQTLRELEIILLDEGDQDRCREIIDQYEQRDPRVVAIHEPNPGASYGAKVNRGLDRARGEFVAIVEPDDYIDPDMYGQMYECAVRTGANIVKTPYYNYAGEAGSTVDKSREYINANVPEERPFSIFRFPCLLAMHPSPWSALYRREKLAEEGVRCLEAPKAGYVDSCFYVDAYVKLGRIVWLDKPFYHWRTDSVTSSSLPENWDRATLLERWNRNLDLYPPQSKKYAVLAPYFANKAWVSVFRHYLEGWEYNEQEYGKLTGFLRRFTAEQIKAMPRVSAEHKELMLRCRNDPEGFRAEYFPEPLAGFKPRTALRGGKKSEKRMGRFKNILKKILPPPVNAFNREMTGLREFIARKDREILSGQESAEERILEALARQQERLAALEESLEAIRAQERIELEALEKSLDTIGEQESKELEELGALRRQCVIASRNSAEGLWASIFNSTIINSTWLQDKMFSPGRMAVGYQYLYVMYRVLNEIRPKRILELGLGQSSRMIAQYSAAEPDVTYVVVEADAEWKAFFEKTFAVPPSCEIVLMDYEMTPYKDEEEVRTFKGFSERFRGQKFDFISIDAPLGRNMKKYSRVDVLKLLPECISEDFVIMMDDYERSTEKNTVAEMEKVLEEAGIAYKTSMYGGKKDCVLITAEHLGFLTTM